MSFTVREGRLLRAGQRFVAVGVDYHPSRAGCRIWTDWDPVALKRDFLAIAEAGLNTVRFFVFWRDFEPEPGTYRPESLSRLRQAVTIAADAGLACIVSLFTIWMNGQRLDLPWRQGRSLWQDAEMLVRQEEFAAEVARAVRGLDNVLAFDLGDEISNVDTGAAAALSKEDVAAWHSRIAGVLRRESDVLVTQANDASGVLGSSPFGVDNARALDLIATHGFPTWAPGSIESTSSYKATNLTAFLVRFAAAYGTPFVDELGSYGVDEATASRYLRASAASALANGASGVLAWCWQDIESSAEPYLQRPAERYAGLRRLDGTAKPALNEFLRVAGEAGRLAGDRPRAPIALYIPERARAGTGSYLDAGAATLATFYSYLLLKRAHLDFDIVTGGLDGYRLVMCPSVTQVTLPDLRRLRGHLDDGGVVYYSMGDHLHGFPGSDLTGVELVDYSLVFQGKSAISWGHDEWPVDWHTGGAHAVTVAAIAGKSLACYPDGTPAVQINQVGRGQVIFCAAPFERQLDQPGRLTSGTWERFYRQVAELAGVWPEVDCDDADVEVVPHTTGAIVINHGSAAVQTELRWRDGGSAPVELAAKDWGIAERGTGVAR